MLLVIVGRPGSGKSTLAKLILQHYPGSRMVSSTTWDRPPRESDHPEDFMRVSEREFDELEGRKQFLWTAEAHGHHFGTLKSQVDTALDSPQLYVAVLVPAAAVQLRQYTNKKGRLSRVKYIYLHVDAEDVLRRRMASRPNTTAEDIENRLAETRLWYNTIRHGTYAIPYQIINTTLTTPEQAFRKVQEVVDAVLLQSTDAEENEWRE